MPVQQTPISKPLDGLPSCWSAWAERWIIVAMMNLPRRRGARANARLVPSKTAPYADMLIVA